MRAPRSSGHLSVSLRRDARAVVRLWGWLSAFAVRISALAVRISAPEARTSTCGSRASSFGGRIFAGPAGSTSARASGGASASGEGPSVCAEPAPSRISAVFLGASSWTAITATAHRDKTAAKTLRTSLPLADVAGATPDPCHEDDTVRHRMREMPHLIVKGRPAGRSGHHDRRGAMKDAAHRAPIWSLTRVARLPGGVAV